MPINLQPWKSDIKMSESNGLSVQQKCAWISGSTEHVLFVEVFKDWPLQTIQYNFNFKLIEPIIDEIVEILGEPDPRFYSRKKFATDASELFLVFETAKILVTKRMRGFSVYFLPETDETLLEQIIEIFEKNTVTTDPKPLIRLLTHRQGRNGGVDHIEFDVNTESLELDGHYNDNVLTKYHTMKTEIGAANSGLWLLQGPPGTGKTTLLRHLIRDVESDFLFIPPQMIGTLAGPALAGYFLENPNQIIIVEDAEDLMKSRQLGDGNLVSILLNLTDGLLGDALKVKILCTVNMELDDIDEAILRPGRMKDAIHIGKLSADKADALLRSIGKEPRGIALTLADIYGTKAEDLFKTKPAIGYLSQGD